MKWLRVLRARCLGLVRKQQIEEELDEELRFHLAMRTQENIRSGMPEADAIRAAKRQLGSVERIKDAYRDVSGGGALEVFLQDVRFAARTLWKDRGFTAIAVLALALGIGANTALFTVLSSVLLRPLPFAAPERIMSVWYHEEGRPETRMPLSYPDFLDLRSQNQSFQRLGGYAVDSVVMTATGGEAMQVSRGTVTSDVFPLLGAKPTLGRVFTSAEDEPGSRAVIISYQLWEEQFGKAGNIRKTQLQLDGQPYSIIGVMPPDFRFPLRNKPVQLWTTFARRREPLQSGAPAMTQRRDAHFVMVLGRLSDGVSSIVAASDSCNIAARIAAMFPQTNRRFDACSVSPWLADLTRGVRSTLLLLIAAALCVLAIACANVANLLLARATTRQKEIAVRAALGAGRRRILRQLLTESLLLSALGAAAGLAVAFVGTPAIVALLPANFPRADEISPDLKVLGFTAIVTLATSCIFGFAPAWRSARCDVARVLNDCGHPATEAPRGRRTRNGLVVTEMVLAFMLLSGAAFLLRNLWQLEHASLGFDPGGVITTQLSLPVDATEPARVHAVAVFSELLERVGRIKGVEQVSAVTPLPVTESHPIADYSIAGRAIAKADLPRSEPRIIEPGYFATLRIPLQRGRDFDGRDTRDAAPVVIVNESLARAAFGDDEAIGKRITPGMTDTGIIAEREIIGVVADAKSDSLAAAPKPEVYLPHSQCVSDTFTLIVRTTLTGEAFLSRLREAADAIDADLAIDQPRPMEDYIFAANAQPRLNSTLLGVFALVAVALATIGVYGVTAYSVAQRRHEIGIRLALGAQKVAIFRLVLGQGIWLVALSLIAGTICSLAAWPVLRTLAYGSSGRDASTLAVVALLLAGTAFIACWVPARRASDEDPLSALGLR